MDMCNEELASMRQVLQDQIELNCNHRDVGTVSRYLLHADAKAASPSREGTTMTQAFSIDDMRLACSMNSSHEVGCF